MTETALLEVDALETGYGKKQVLFGVSVIVAPGDIVGIIGPNGAGKSTVLRAVCGLLPAWRGEIRFSGQRIDGSTSARNVACGMAFCPQGNRVFDELSVIENLEIGGFQLPREELKQRIAQALELFPVLDQRSRQEAGRLSGGEQQMLALARAMIPKPKLLMLDEPSLGLSPGLVKEVFAKIAEISHNTGVAILIVEQKVRDVLGICSRVYSLKLGEVAFEGVLADLQQNPDRLKELFL